MKLQPKTVRNHLWDCLLMLLKKLLLVLKLVSFQPRVETLVIPLRHYAINLLKPYRLARDGISYS